MQIEATIHRARILLAYIEWVDVVMRLVDEGIEPGQAYLATKAALHMGSGPAHEAQAALHGLSWDEPGACDPPFISSEELMSHNNGKF